MTGRRIKLIRAIFRPAVGMLLLLSVALAVPVAADSVTTISGSFTVHLVTSSVTASGISASYASISWDTNGNATSQVFYDTQYHDNTADYMYHSDIDATLVSHHSILLNGLSPSTVYHYRVKSVTTVAGVEVIAISPDYTFSTTSSGGIFVIYPTTTPIPGITPAPTTTTTTPVCIITTTLPPPETTTTPSVGETTIEIILPDGTSATFTVDQDGRLVNPYTLTTEDGLFTLTFDSGTKLSTSTGRMPSRIAITNVSFPTMTGNEAIIHICEVTAYTEDGVPTHVDLAPPVLLTLNYDPAELPDDTTTVYLVYYNESLGAWTKMEPPPGYVAKPGELATLLSHLSKYGILVDTTPSVIVVPKSHILYWLIPAIIVPVLLLVFLFIIIHGRRKKKEQGK